MALFGRRDDDNADWIEERLSNGDLIRWQVRMENFDQIQDECMPYLKAAARKDGKTLHDYVSWVAHMRKSTLHEWRDKIMNGQATEEQASVYQAWLEVRRELQEVQYRMMKPSGQWYWA